MAPSIRKALGTVKDQTSIGLAKMSRAMAPELVVAIIKATSHDDETADEKYLRGILAMTSYSRGYVTTCMATVSRRLRGTRDWVVALKALMLLHRLMADGEPAFLNEIMYATRRGARLLDMAGFRDAAHSDSWDHSAFVRSYALYLDQRLEFIVYEKWQSDAVRSDQSPRDHWRWTPPPHRPDLLEEPEHYSNGSHGRYSYSSPSENGVAAAYDEQPEGKEEKTTTTLMDMKTERLLGRIHQLQQLFDRFLGCRPRGNAEFCRLILVALFAVVRESFQLYSDVVETLSIILDRFFDMEDPQCGRSFEAYTRAAKQIDELCGFYAWCKDIGVARSSEYPDVQRITDKLLVKMEDFMRIRARKPKSPSRDATPAIISQDDKEEPVQDMNSVSALPAPSVYTEEQPQQTSVEPARPPQQHEGDLLDLRDDAASAEERSDSLALALFQGPSAANGDRGPWDAFPSSNREPGVTSEWKNPVAEPGSADWELLLVETASNLSKQKAALCGGFDPLLLDGMYVQGIVRQHADAQTHGGSASSVALPAPGKSATPVLALPAPDGTAKPVGQDPFAASLSIPPPSYVQMADIVKKQQLLVEEQFMWQQFANERMQGMASSSKLQTTFISNQQMQTPYTVPTAYGTAGGFYHGA